jgi:hypothetical protein
MKKDSERNIGQEEGKQEKHRPERMKKRETLAGKKERKKHRLGRRKERNKDHEEGKRGSKG